MAERQWRRSSYTNANGNCVEFAYELDIVRDSKDPAGPTLRVEVTALVAAVKDGRLGR